MEGSMVGSIVVVGVLTQYALHHSVCELKVAPMNVQYRLIWKLIHYQFELGHNTTQPTKNIYCMKGEGAVDHSTVTRWFKKFCSSCKNDDQEKAGRPKTIDSKAMLQAIEANLLSSTGRVSGKLSISQSSVVYHFHNLNKSIQSC